MELNFFYLSLLGNVVAIVAIVVCLIRTWSYNSLARNIKNRWERHAGRRTAELIAINESLRGEIERRNAAEAELISNEARFSAVVNIAGDAIITVNDKHEIRTFNPAAEVIFGYKSSEVIGKSVNVLIPSRFHHSHQVQAVDFIKGAVASKLMANRSAVLGVRKNGEEFPAEASIASLDVGRERLGAVILRDITERARNNEALENSLREKEVLLREIHHRVKNNLQIITSLLNLQARQTKEPLALGAIIESQNRVRSISLVHQVLYQSDRLNSVDCNKYLTELCTNLLRSYGRASDISLGIEACGVGVSVDIAVPLGLIVNELVSNSIKYAFPNRASEAITVSLISKHDGTYELAVIDNGVGVADVGMVENAGTLGLRLVRNLVDQINGTLSFETSAGNGMKAMVTFRM